VLVPLVELRTYSLQQMYISARNGERLLWRIRHSKAPSSSDGCSLEAVIGDGDFLIAQ